jgi:hypothetical protein
MLKKFFQTRAQLRDRIELLEAQVDMLRLYKQPSYVDPQPGKTIHLLAGDSLIVTDHGNPVAQFQAVSSCALERVS